MEMRGSSLFTATLAI